MRVRVGHADERQGVTGSQWGTPQTLLVLGLHEVFHQAERTWQGKPYGVADKRRIASVIILSGNGRSRVGNGNMTQSINGAHDIQYFDTDQLT